MANPIKDLKEAQELNLKLKGEVESALQLATTAEGENKVLKAENEKLAADIKIQEASILEYASTVEKLKASQAEFDSKVAAAALTVVASQGVPAIAISPSLSPSIVDSEKEKISKLKGLAKVTAAFQMEFEAKQKAKK